MSSMMDQHKFVHDFAAKTTIPFNPRIFARSDAEIGNAVKKIILSCQRDAQFKILVKGFTMIDGFHDVNETLRLYQDSISKKGSKGKSDEDNRFACIDLKGSALRLLVVTYFASIKGQSDTFDVIIALPRVVDKFYFYLNGNYYSSMYQIVDGSTYNNMTSTKSDSHCVSLKTAFHPIRIFRNINKLVDTKEEFHDATHYDCLAFTKVVPTSLYVIAQYGLYHALEFFGMSNVIFISDSEMDPERYYSFQPQFRLEVIQSKQIYICVPKMIYDGNYVCQHLVYTLVTQIFLSDIDGSVTIQDIFANDFWVYRLGCCYTASKTADKFLKGQNVLQSLRGVYDIGTKEDIRLPDYIKRDIFRILQWMVCEFNNLRLKDNLDIRTKKINVADYIAAMYANKLVYGIYSLSDNPRAELKSIKKALITNPMYLIQKITKSQLINFRDTVTDMDSIVALSCTYKGETGIGENSPKSIPRILRFLDASNMGILDPDGSSASDPGISGSLVPSAKIYGNGFLGDYKEPVTWADEYSQLFDNYKKQRGLIDVIKFQKNVLGQMSCEQVDEHMAKEGLEMVKSMVDILEPVEDYNNEIPMEGSGHIVYEWR